MSELFDDPFYSRNDGRAEAVHVFLEGNGLPERWADHDCFSIAELGFGTGLNFLETWRQWIVTRRTGQRLVFTSFEAYPLAYRDIERALGVWDDGLGPLADEMLRCWKGSQQGRRRWRMDEQTELVVVDGEAERGVAGWDGFADAWYLDGFSPAKNPGMWSAPLMREVFEHTAVGGGFATYTAAGWVRRNLVSAGFEVSKRPGFAGKREMAVGKKC